MKYSGADWLSNYKTLSPFGVKVADVLGQTYRGIYHIDSYVLNKKARWTSLVDICVIVSGELATYDHDLLTRLVLNCEAQGIKVQLHGSFKGYTKLLFITQRPTVGKLLEVDNIPSSWDEPPSTTEFIRDFTHVKSILCDGGYSVEPISWSNLQRLVRECHYHAIRCSLIGRSPYTLEARLTHRSPTGSFYERHPTLESVRLNL